MSPLPMPKLQELLVIRLLVWIIENALPCWSVSGIAGKPPHPVVDQLKSSCSKIRLVHLPCGMPEGPTRLTVRTVVLIPPSTRGVSTTVLMGVPLHEDIVLADAALHSGKIERTTMSFYPFRLMP